MSQNDAERGDGPERVETTGDTEAALQAELHREAAEGGKLVGDMQSNTNVSGSSTWTTLPEADGSDDVGDNNR